MNETKSKLIEAENNVQQLFNAIEERQLIKHGKMATKENGFWRSNFIQHQTSNLYFSNTSNQLYLHLLTNTALSTLLHPFHFQKI